MDNKLMNLKTEIRCLSEFQAAKKLLNTLYVNYAIGTVKMLGINSKNYQDEALKKNYEEILYRIDIKLRDI